MRKLPEYSFEKLRNEVEICVSDEHKFGTDAFLLADFAAPRHKDMVCDLGTGCGIIPLLMQISFAPKIIYCVDIQKQAIEQLNISVERNKLENIVPVCADLKTLWQGAPIGQLDVVTCNPPYKSDGAGLQSLSEAQRIARHEILCNISDVCRAAERLLKFGGRFCICNRPERLADVVSAMKDNNIEPKSLRFVSKTPADPPWLFLIEGKKGGKPFMKVLPQLYINGSEGFSEELLQIYGGGKTNDYQREKE
ncbi:MAG: methyltransferase [Oscillospiraceae bacterium]|jgi:tRNA1(Val) A37 N6-methylase TrmN6|nr:methyltransferase [Oscillospiraceae bacterium]